MICEVIHIFSHHFLDNEQRKIIAPLLSDSLVILSLFYKNHTLSMFSLKIWNRFSFSVKPA